jgi:hypothetical protein
MNGGAAFLPASDEALAFIQNCLAREAKSN